MLALVGGRVRGCLKMRPADNPWVPAQKKGGPDPAVRRHPAGRRFEGPCCHPRICFSGPAHLSNSSSIVLALASISSFDLKILSLSMKGITFGIGAPSGGVTSLRVGA